MYKVLALTVLAAAQIAFTSVSRGENDTYSKGVAEFVLRIYN
jgi:hypothetical protein